MNDLGELLRELRGKRSLREIGELTELSHTYISDVEKGYRRGTKKPINPSPETLKRLADAYNYPYEKLLNVAGYLKQEEKEIEIDGQIIHIPAEAYMVFQEIMKHPVAFENLKKDPQKHVKQMIRTWENVLKAMNEVEDDDCEYLE